MKNIKIYEADDKMISLIKDNYSVLQSLGGFGINLGFGDKTVRETCELNKVDTYTFLSVVNFTINSYSDFEGDIESLDVPTLLHYLEASHTYYLDFQLPFIREELEESIDERDRLGQLIMKFYDEYANEIRQHMQYEQKMLFPYVESLMKGNPSPNFNIDTYSRHHDAADKRLKELKLTIIKYLPSDSHLNNKLTATLYDIYNNEEWLRLHALVEDHIFVPAIKLMERRSRKESVAKNITSSLYKMGQDGGDTLSERERDVVVAVVQGMQNKEIADHLCISVNTVITHRRNIARKLQIHSTSGLTIYAIVNGLVDITSVNL